MSMVRSLALALVLIGAALGQNTPSPGKPNESPLASMKRICVQALVGDESLVAPAKEIAIAALFSSQRFTVTEKCESADAILKGAVLERGEKRLRAEGEAADFGVAGGGASATRHSAASAFGAALGGSGESLLSAETKTSASVTLRLVDKNGDVIWAYTQDSGGGKSKSALADAVDRAIRHLLKQADRNAAGS